MLLAQIEYLEENFLENIDALIDILNKHLHTNFFTIRDKTSDN